MRNFLVPRWIKKYRQIYRERGLKALVKETPLWVLVAVFVFYLIRDILLYILIPYLVAKGILL